MLVDQRHHLAPRQRIERPRVEIRVALIPLRKRRGDGDDVARLRQRAGLQDQFARSRQLLIRQANFARGERGAVGDEDAKVKRLERSGRDGDGGCDPEPANQTLISLTSSATISFGSVMLCTSSTLTPGASSINLNPFSVTSSTQ